MLRDQEDQLLGSSRLDRRNKILKQLCKATPMANETLNLDLENYRLVVGERIGYNFRGQSFSAPSPDRMDSSNPDAPPHMRTLNLWEYIESLRHSERQPRPTIYFPEPNAGPDLVFALEPKEPKLDQSSERVLCVVQVKTAGASVNATKAIMTTDLCQAYLKKPLERSDVHRPGTHLSQRDPRPRRRCSNPCLRYDPTQKNAVPKRLQSDFSKMQDEMKHWKDRTVIRILISTQQEHVQQADFEAVKKNRSKNNELKDHFVMFSKAPSNGTQRSEDQSGTAYVDHLFGDDFMSLLKQMKSNDTDKIITAQATPAAQKAKREEREAAKNQDCMNEALEGGLGFLNKSELDS